MDHFLIEFERPFSQGDVKGGGTLGLTPRAAVRISVTVTPTTAYLVSSCFTSKYCQMLEERFKGSWK